MACGVQRLRARHRARRRPTHGTGSAPSPSSSSPPHPSFQSPLCSLPLHLLPCLHRAPPPLPLLLSLLIGFDCVSLHLVPHRRLSLSASPPSPSSPASTDVDLPLRRFPSPSPAFSIASTASSLPVLIDLPVAPYSPFTPPPAFRPHLPCVSPSIVPAIRRRSPFATAISSPPCCRAPPSFPCSSAPTTITSVASALFPLHVLPFLCLRRRTPPRAATASIAAVAPAPCSPCRTSPLSSSSPPVSPHRLHHRSAASISVVVIPTPTSRAFPVLPSPPPASV